MGEQKITMKPDSAPRDKFLLYEGVAQSDLARARAVRAGRGCELALRHGVKFTESSAGMGHRVDELLVGIVMQLR